MSYTLQQYRDYVRAHLDVDDEDIADALIDAWCREATEAIVQYRSHWPFLQYDWDLAVTPDVADYEFADAFSPTLGEIASITGIGRVVQWVPPDDADFLTHIAATRSRPLYFSWWGTTLSLYPTPVDVETLAVRGWRQVADWAAGGAGASADLPAEFDEVIRNRLLGEAYTQQEDPEMGQLYFSKAQGLLTVLGSRLGVTPSMAPLIMGGGGVHA